MVEPERFRFWLWPPARRYPIHSHADVTWTLVFEASSGHWYVEKAGPQKARLRYTPEELENSEKGRLLGDQLLVTLHAAERDL